MKSHTFHFSDDKEDTAGGHEARQRQQLEVIQRRETGEASGAQRGTWGFHGMI